MDRKKLEYSSAVRRHSRSRGVNDIDVGIYEGHHSHEPSLSLSSQMGSDKKDETIEFLVVAEDFEAIATVMLLANREIALAAFASAIIATNPLAL
ncbi:hypothetical protein OE766_03705 [Pararhizobium sp. YC-54]|uniref:hypothetical protein n=1 Tax=Pararhizobium sp. YC-54 TaxID=2986920 RepID=UPI0021F74895|nr:hypothetical protein [Pararhizobium sp. YC-54]MCV9997343.1 hypothetical protein [Pararhizobium sp. YC-54]